MSGALEGITVVELGRYIAAPYAGKLLGDLGAEVIKVEDTDRGDPMRVWQSGDRPYSPQFAAYNRNKRGIAVDLKSDDGRKILLRLVRRCDVLIENFRPGVMDRLDIGWDVLSDVNPQLIYCAVTGFGQQGPYVDRPAYDTIISAMSGMYGMVIDPDSPRPVGPAFSDLLSGLFAALSVTSALHARGVTGRGQRIDVSMLGAVLGFITEAATTYLDTGEVTHRDTRQRRAQAYGLSAKDDLPFVVHMSVPEKFWIALTEAMGLAHLRDDPRFEHRSGRYEHYDELDSLLKEAARTRTRREWMEILAEADVPHSPVNSLEEVFSEAQVEAMAMVEEVPTQPGSRPMKLAGRFATLVDTPITTRRLAPRHGEHTNEILRQLGIEAEAIASLTAKGTVK